MKIGGLLRRIAPALRANGIEILTGKKVGKLRTRIVEISRIGGSKPVWVGPVVLGAKEPVKPSTTAAEDASAQVTPSVEAANPIATTTTAVTGDVNPLVVPPVPDDLELQEEEVKKKRRTRKAA